MTSTTIRRAATLALVLSTVVVHGVAASTTTASCAPPPASGPVPGGEWRFYGQDITNNRTQPDENAINSFNVSQLKLAWSYASTGQPFNNTPIIADGCAYLADASGTLTARNADTGRAVWTTHLPTAPEAFGGGLVATPAIDDARLYIIINRQGGPYLEALDRATGALAWHDPLVLDTQPAAASNSSPVVFNGMVFAGFSGNAGAGHTERGGYVIADALTGALLHKQFVIDDAHFQRGYDGAGIWSTPAIDLATGYAYVGTSNPHSPQKEDDKADSIIKIDVDPARTATFGTIVDHYNGLPDTYIPGLANQPVCKRYPGAYYLDRFSASCVQVDLDFGASPSLYTVGGRQLLGDLQKAGVFHIVDPTTMTGVAQQIVGIPCLACNAASPATTGGAVYTAAGPPGQLFRLDGTSALPKWVGVLNGVTTYNAVSVANGVVYTVDGDGFLDGFDAATGAPVLKHPLALEAGGPVVSASSASGIAIARHTLYVAATNHVFAFRLNGSGAVPGLPGAPGGGAGLPILSLPGSVATTFLPPLAVVPQGSGATYINLDIANHNVQSTQGLFRSAVVSTGGTAAVVGVENLPPGSYPYICVIHPYMKGTLRIV